MASPIRAEGGFGLLHSDHPGGSGARKGGIQRSEGAMAPSARAALGITAAVVFYRKDLGNSETRKPPGVPFPLHATVQKDPNRVGALKNEHNMIERGGR
jgi:hypothetical protein